MVSMHRESLPSITPFFFLEKSINNNQDHGKHKEIKTSSKDQDDSKGHAVKESITLYGSCN